MTIRNILVMNGPNLDMLGTREPEVYGNETLVALEEAVGAYGRTLGFQVSCFQSNSEGELIGKIHEAPKKFDAIIYNPGAHTHYSYALRDAVGSISIPVLEVHLSDIDTRESFRQQSVIAPACVGQVKGLGVDGYRRAMDLLAEGERFHRLGEDYHQRVPAGSTIVVSTADGLLYDAPAAAPAPVQAAPPVMATARSQRPTAQATVGAPMAAKSNEELLLFGDGAAQETIVEAAAAPRAVQVASEKQEDAGAAAAEVVTGAAPEDLTAPFAAQVHAQDRGLASVERQTLLRLACARMGVGAILVRDTANIQWLCALDDVFDEERAHGLLVAANMAVLHTDSRYADALRRAIKATGDGVIVDDRRQSHARFAWDVLTQGGKSEFGAKLGIEDTITYAEFVKMVEQFKTENLSPTTDAVLKLRAVKDAGELVRLRAAQAVTDAAFAHIRGFMKPGMTERQVQLELEDFMVRHGAEGVAFRSIVAAGANGADPHALPGSTRLQAGQCVVMDFGARAFGYCSDMTRTVFLGAPDQEMAKAWEVLRRANETVEALIKPGVTGAEAHQAAEQVLADGGFANCMGHGVGHGVGLEVHELPTLNPRSQTALVEGNVVTVEPGIYQPGRFGMRLEDFGVVTADGFDVFTQSTHEMVII